VRQIFRHLLTCFKLRDYKPKVQCLSRCEFSGPAHQTDTPNLDYDVSYKCYLYGPGSILVAHGNDKALILEATPRPDLCAREGVVRIDRGDFYVWIEQKD
jgi:hypothetical protein